MQLKPGSRWKSAVCQTEVVVVRPPAAEVTLACGGVAMLAPGEAAADGAAMDPAHAGGSLLGKRYTDAASGIELLCAKGGAGSLTIDGRPASVKDAKKLPSSD